MPAESLREAIEESFSQVEARETGTEIANVSNPAEAAPEGGAKGAASAEVASEETDAAASEAQAAADRARDDKGRFAKGEAGKPAPVQKLEKPKVVPPAAAAKGAPPAKGAPAVEGEAGKPPAPELKPPQSWKPLAREKWAALPAEVQGEVDRREREMSKAMQEVAGARKFAQEFYGAVAPFEPMLRADGRHPVKAFGELLQLEHTLRSGSMSAKVATIARIINDSGVRDSAAALNALDQALAGGGAAPGRGGAAEPGEYRDPRVDQLITALEQQKRQGYELLSRKTSVETSKFAEAHEFFDDVREDMADLIEARARKGVELSLEDAYNLAVKLHPEISGVLTQREAAKQAANANASTQKARAAGASIKSTPAGTSGKAQPETLRDYIEHAFDDVNGR